MQPVAHALADLVQRFLVLGIEVDGVAKAAAEQQMLERHRANDYGRNGQRDERPGHRPHLLQWRSAVMTVTMIVMSVIVARMRIMRTMAFFRMRLMLFS